MKKDIVQDYIQRFPELPNKTLASMIFTKEEGLFLDVEAARKMIRYYKGADGPKSKKVAENQNRKVEHSSVKEGLGKLGLVSKAENVESVE